MKSVIVFIIATILEFIGGIAIYLMIFNGMEFIARPIIYLLIGIALDSLNRDSGGNE